MVPVGLVSDTHGVFDSAAAAQLKHVQLLLHARDVGHHGGHKEVLQQFSRATGAPILAVAGNTDDALDAADQQLLPQHRLVNVAGWKLLLTHIVAAGPHAKVDPEAAALIQQLQPDIVVCGHSHKAAAWEAEGVLYINPGSAGPARFKLPRTVAVLHLPPKDHASALGLTPAASPQASNQPQLQQQQQQRQQLQQQQQQQQHSQQSQQLFTCDPAGGVSAAPVTGAGTVPAAGAVSRGGDGSIIIRGSATVKAASSNLPGMQSEENQYSAPNACSSRRSSSRSSREHNPMVHKSQQQPHTAVTKATSVSTRSARAQELEHPGNPSSSGVGSRSSSTVSGDIGAAGAGVADGSEGFCAAHGASGNREINFGQLEVKFLQLPQKAPARLKFRSKT